MVAFPRPGFYTILRMSGKQFARSLFPILPAAGTSGIAQALSFAVSPRLR